MNNSAQQNLAGRAAMISDKISANRDHLVSPYTDDCHADEANEALEVALGELRSLQTKIAKVKVSEHKLRVENLALRTRLERLKSKRSFEIRALGFCLLLVFILAVGTTAFVFAF